MLQASDRVVWRFAQVEQRAVVTANSKDFLRLAADSNHAGLLLIPNGGTRDEQFAYIKAAWTHVWQSDVYEASFENRVATVNESRMVSVTVSEKQAAIVSIKKRVH